MVHGIWTWPPCPASSRPSIKWQWMGLDKSFTGNPDKEDAECNIDYSFWRAVEEEKINTNKETWEHPLRPKKKVSSKPGTLADSWLAQTMPGPGGEGVVPSVNHPSQNLFSYYFPKRGQKKV